MKAVIMAGGRGTRISSLTRTIPKPMIKVDGKPILEHEIECLREQNVTDIIVTVNYLRDAITDYFGDGSALSPATGKAFGVNISYYIETEPMGNAGALFEFKDQLTEDFLLLNGDALFRVDIARLVAAHRAFGGLATLFTHPNSHPYDSALIVADKNCAVTKWITKEDDKPEYYHNQVNAGLHILSPELLKNRPITAKVDLDRQILKPLAGTGKLFCYESSEYVKDMGTPERYAAVCEDYHSGIVEARDLRKAQRAVFLDRDGVINEYVGFLRDTREFKLLPGVADAIRRLNNSGRLVIVVTNQPVIARGEIMPEQLDEIHKKMETLLGKEGAYLDAIYYCPHHPDKGYPGEIAELKINCPCRKPKPGMLLRAAEDYHVDLASSWMVGDGENDIKAGIAAGCQTALIDCKGRNYGQTVTGSSLAEAVKLILKNEENHK